MEDEEFWVDRLSKIFAKIGQCRQHHRGLKTVQTSLSEVFWSRRGYLSPKQFLWEYKNRTKTTKDITDSCHIFPIKLTLLSSYILKNNSLAFFKHHYRTLTFCK